MSYVLSGVSRGSGAVAASDDLRPARTALGLVVGGRPLPQRPAPRPLTTPIRPSAPPDPGRIISSQGLNVTTFPIPPIVAGSTTPPPPPVRIQRVDPAAAQSCQGGYFYSSVKQSCQPNCAAGYYLDSGDNCLPIQQISQPATPPPSPLPSVPPPDKTATTRPEIASTQPVGVQEFLAARPAPLPFKGDGGTQPEIASTQPVMAYVPKPGTRPEIASTQPSGPPAASSGGGTATWQMGMPQKPGASMGPLAPDLDVPIYQTPAPPAARAGISTTQILLFGALGLGALYLFTRK